MSSLEHRIGVVRGFGRFYTKILGLLSDGLLDTSYSLPEARVIFELAQAERFELSRLREALDLDAGYLSRVVGGLAQKGLLKRERSATDARRQVVSLTSAGRDAFVLLDGRSAEQIRALLAGLNEDAQARLVAAMGAIQAILLPRERPRTVVLRAPRSGDFGWVVERHGSLYAEEYGWDATFESLVARIVADYVERPEPRRQASWIAEVDGERVGCVFCTQKTGDVAQLRLLLVEPAARGLGIGGRLVDECLDFARRSGYQQMTLWTNDVLHAARRLYENAGFRLVESSSHHSFGRDLVGQNWELDL